MNEMLCRGYGDVNGGINEYEDVESYRDAKTATRTMNGIYVKNETPAMIRHRNLHVLASRIRLSRHIIRSQIGRVPCSICGSSSGTAFSVSEPPTTRVLGIGRIDATHHKGKRMNEI